jgi:hypothetical protein
VLDGGVNEDRGEIEVLGLLLRDALLERLRLVHCLEVELGIVGRVWEWTGG